MDRPVVLHVNLLAGFRVAVGERSVPAAAWRQKRVAAVIKLLALEPVHRLHREQVLDALWPDLDLESSAGNLRVALHHARNRLVDAGATPGVFLVRDGESLALSLGGAIRVDVDVFEQAAARAWQVAEPEAIEVALGHYPGDLLPDDLFDDWAVPRRMSLRASYLTLLARLARLAEQRTEIDRAVAAYQRILILEPAQEESHVALMHLFALGGQRSQALAQYRALVAVLEQEMGTVPEPATRTLYDAIRNAQPTRLEPLREPARTPRWTMLPAPVDALIGRDRERAEIRQLLATLRLVTLTGSGGVGKTRLALAVASDVMSTFADGAVFVDLSPIRDPALVLSAVAQAADIYDTDSRPQIEALAVTLQEKRLLLLLDNFEQVIDAAPIVANLLRRCPGLKVLVTSRVRLRLRGEQEYPVEPLALPFDQASVIAASAAGQLFVQRAAEARPDFVLTPQNAATVGEICRRLDGLPLALELAAAQVRTLPPKMLLERLDAPLALLTGGTRDMPERHQTIRATIAWSHDLLSDVERCLFRRLAVFAGIWTLAAAEAVIDLNGDLGISVLDGLTSLVDQSLLQSVNGGRLRETETRFAMLETIREFALEQLIASGEDAGVRRRHVTFYVGLAETADADLTSSQQQMWLDRLDADRTNLRAALDWALEEDVIMGLQLAGALGRFWGMRGSVTEGRAHLDALLAVPSPAQPATRARALNAAGLLARLHGDTGRAEALVDEAVHLWRSLDNRSGLIPALYARAWHAKERNDLELATSRFEECLALAREGGDRFHVAACLVSRAEIANDQGDTVRADALQWEGVALFQELGDSANVGWSIYSMAAMTIHRGQPATALPLLETALANFRKVDEARGVAWSLVALAEATWLLAAPKPAPDVASVDVSQAMGSRAAGLYAEALGLAMEFKDKRIIVSCLEGLATVALWWGKTDETIRLLGATSALRETIPYPLGPHARGVVDCLIDSGRRALDDRAFTTDWSVGRALSLSLAVELAEETAAAIAARPRMD